jgi:hypothetical protein
LWSLSLQFFAAAFWSETDMCLCYCASEFDMHISVAFQMPHLPKCTVVTWTASSFVFVFMCVILPWIIRHEDTWAIVQVSNYFNKWHINLLRSTLFFASLLGTSCALIYKIGWSVARNWMECIDVIIYGIAFMEDVCVCVRARACACAWKLILLSSSMDAVVINYFNDPVVG